MVGVTLILEPGAFIPAVYLPYYRRPYRHWLRQCGAVREPSRSGNADDTGRNYTCFAVFIDVVVDAAGLTIRRIAGTGKAALDRASIASEDSAPHSPGR
jgi:hypothetical protein